MDWKSQAGCGLRHLWNREHCQRVFTNGSLFYAKLAVAQIDHSSINMYAL